MIEIGDAFANGRKRSLSRIVGGMTHCGLKTTYCISALKSGVSRYGLPTMTRVLPLVVPFSTYWRVKSAILTMI